MRGEIYRLLGTLLVGMSLGRMWIKGIDPIAISLDIVAAWLIVASFRAKYEADK
jgi:hypothetical protein